MDAKVQEMFNTINDSKNETSPFNKLIKLIDDDRSAEAIAVIQHYFDCDEISAKLTFVEFVLRYDETKKRRKENMSEASKAEIRNVNEGVRYIPKCPTCGSPRIKRLLFGGGIVVVGNYGWGGKTFECKDCGYMW